MEEQNAFQLVKLRNHTSQFLNFRRQNMFLLVFVHSFLLSTKEDHKERIHNPTCLLGYNPMCLFLIISSKRKLANYKSRPNIIPSPSAITQHQGVHMNEHYDLKRTFNIIPISDKDSKSKVLHDLLSNQVNIHSRGN